MKRIFIVALALLCFGAAVYGALTYDQSYYRNNRGYLGSATSSDPLYNFWGTLEGLYEGTTAFDAVRIAESTGSNYTKIIGGNQSASLTLTLPTAYAGASGYVLSSTDAGVLSWVANGGTYTGGSITSDVNLADGVDIYTAQAVSDSNSAIQGYDNDGSAYVDALRVTNGDTVAVALGSATTSLAIASTGLDVSTAGAISNATTIGASGVVTAGGWSGTGNFAQGDGTGSASFSTSSWDLSTAGALSGITTLSLSDDITMANGKGVKSSTTTAQTVGVYGYDTDGEYVGAVVVTNSATPATVLGNANGTSAITSSDWAISTTGAMTGIGAITTDGTLTYNAAAMTVYSNEATTWTHATNGAADDWTLALTGATNSSILIDSAGTGTDAVGIASDGGITLTSTAVASAWTHTSTGDADDLTISVAGNTNSSLILSSAGSGTDSLSLSTVTNSGDIVISSHDKIDIDSTGTFALNAAGDTLLIQVDSDGAADDLTIKVDGDDDSSIILDSDGTGADAVKIGATNAAGGIDIDAGTNGIDILGTGGAVAIGTTKNAASAIALTANGGANETIVVTNTQGTGTGAIALNAIAGGVTLAAGADDAVAATSGSGGISMNVSTNQPTNINTGTSTGTVTIGGAAAQTIAIGTGAAAKAVTLGSKTGASATIIQSGSADLDVDVSGAIDMDAVTTFDVLAGGAFSIDGSNAASNISLATNGDADDLTIGLTGATNSSIILNSTGTGTDAIGLVASAGSINLSAPAGGVDITGLTGHSIAATATADASYGLEVSGAIAGATRSEGAAAYFHSTITGNVDGKVYNIGSWLDITGGTPADGGGTEVMFSAADFGIYGAAAGAELADAKVRVLNLEYQVDADCAPVESSTFIHFNCLDTEDTPDYLFTTGNAASAVYTANVTHTTAATDKIGAIKINIGAIGDAYIYVYSHAGQ